MTDTSAQWKDFLNPDILRTRMLTASLFLVAHEMLVSAVKSRLHDFYLVGFDERGLRYSPRYAEQVLCLDPKGKKDPWRASLVWLEQREVIDPSDAENIRLCTNARNAFAHELNEIISGRTNPDFDSLFPILVELVVKIDKWWIINVELETDPDRVDDIDLEGVVPGSQLMLSIVHQCAIGDQEAAKALYQAFVESVGPKS
jgi:hypothetical protein